VEEDDSYCGLKICLLFILPGAGLWNPLECCERATHHLPSLLFRVSELNPSRRPQICGSSKHGVRRRQGSTTKFALIARSFD